VFDPLALGEGGELLAQTTRARLFQLLAQLGREATTAELARTLNLNRNGVRSHLERMARAGLVERRRRTGTRGRPADLWRVAGAVGERLAPTAALNLGSWLARAVPPTSENLAAVEAEGRRIGRELPFPAGEGGLPALLAALASLGFAPRGEERPPGGLAIRLGNCPFRQAAVENGPLVCAFHRGLTAGLLERLWPQAALAGFAPADPRAAGCRIELGQRRGEAAAAGPTVL